MEIEHAAANDPVLIGDWFDHYKAVQEKFCILPLDEYNLDESGFCIGIGGKQWVITRVIVSRVGTKRVGNH
jgi:hypothetical protein